jgi:methyl-accepting chemotaxis protein
VKRNQNRRQLRNFILNKKQLGVVIVSSVYFFVAITAILMTVMTPMYGDIYKSDEVSVQRESAKVFIILSEKLVIALSAVFIFTIIPLIWVSHRFFGPLINFSNIFKRVAQGDLTARVYLRRGDLLTSEAYLVNDMINSLSNSISDIEKQHNLLVMALMDVVENSRPQGRLIDDLIKVHSQALVCQNLLSKFRTAEVADQKNECPDSSASIQGAAN